MNPKQGDRQTHRMPFGPMTTEINSASAMILADSTPDLLVLFSGQLDAHSMKYEVGIDVIYHQPVCKPAPGCFCPHLLYPPLVKIQQEITPGEKKGNQRWEHADLSQRLGDQRKGPTTIDTFCRGRVFR